jgi:hypothetical protein
VTTRLRDAFDTDTPLGTAFAGPWLPFVGITLALIAHIDPPGTTFYETTAQVGVGLLVAYVFENARVSARHPNRGWALSLNIGIALGVVEALLASLWAIARNDGSVILAGITIGGLLWGVVFLFAPMWRSAAVAGAFGEDEVVGGGEGGGERAEEDRVGAEG